jgi:serine/threonine protein phosphatase 1
MFRRLKIWRFGQESTPRLPEGLRIYAFGDVHGRLDLLDALLHRVAHDIDQQPACEITYVFLGDYVDRGPKSAEVISRLIEHARDHRTICLKGNHEIYLMQFLNDPNMLEDWTRLGALPTLTSYGLTPTLRPTSDERGQLSADLNSNMPDAHKVFLTNLSPYFSCGDYFFVHAGVRPGVALAKQSESDFLYIRDEFLCHKSKYEKFIVHGHTPVKQPDRHPNRINIDTGAYATGRLTCLCLESDQMRFI